jgi:hypothetical protein
VVVEPGERLLLGLATSLIVDAIMLEALEPPDENKLYID